MHRQRLFYERILLSGKKTFSLLIGGIYFYQVNYNFQCSWNRWWKFNTLEQKGKLSYDVR